MTVERAAPATPSLNTKINNTNEILERYNYTLPGNITLKSPADAARAELEKLEEEIKSYNVPCMLTV